MLRRSGNALVMSIIFLVSIGVLVMVNFSRSANTARISSQRVNDQDAIRVAEAGIEKAVWCLNTPTAPGADCPKDASSNYIGESNVVFGRGKFTTTVSISGNTASIDSIGTLSGSNGTSSKELQVNLATTNVGLGFNYGMQAGVGGIDLDNNAAINGNVYTNGSVTGSNGSSITGDAVLAVSSPTVDASADPSTSPTLATANFATAAATTYIAQSFIAQNDDKLYSVDLKLAKSNAPTSSITIYVYGSDGSGNLDTTNNITGASGQALTATVPIDTAGGWYSAFTNQTFSSGTQGQMVAGQKYWLVLKASSTNATKFWKTVTSSADTLYASGSAYTGSTISTITTALNVDLAFRLNIGGIPATLNIPSVTGNAYAHTIDSTDVGKDAYYAVINPTVRANGGTDTCTTGAATVHCHNGQSDQSPKSLPIQDSQVTVFEAQGTSGGITNCSTPCTVSSGSIGPREYDGDLTLSGTVTLTGTIWVKGNLTVNGIVKLSSSFGSNSGTIVVDDPANRATKGMITTGVSACLEKYSSASTNYLMVIAMSDNLGNGSAAAINVGNDFCKDDVLGSSVLYASNGSIDLSNNAEIKELAGQRIHLSNNVTATYEIGLASVLFSSGPGGSWTYQKGSYQIL